MSSNNLFGQYYNNLGKNKVYTGIEYNCSSATSGENTLIFREGEARLVDSNGNIVGKIDLSKINAGPMTSWTSGTIVINPGEAKLIEGIEYGKLYKHVYFEVPQIYVSSLDKAWEYLVNAKFTILMNVDLDLREYEVKTTTSVEDKTSIVDRVQKLIDEIGADGNIQVSIEEIEDGIGNTKTYLVFKSLVLGYDFIITDLCFSNHRIVRGDTLEFIEDLIPEETLEDIHDAEDNILFNDGTSFDDNDDFSGPGGEEVGHYDGDDNLTDQTSADHYYEGQDSQDIEEPDEDAPQEDETQEESSGSQEQQEDSEEGEEDVSTDEQGPDEEAGDEDDDTILARQEFCVDRDKDLEIDAFKYPNGAARAWLIVPEWPTSVDEQYVSLKLNHVKDHVIVFDHNEDADCNCYDLSEVDVYASERNEIERHNLKAMRYFTSDNFAYMDSVNGSVTEVLHQEEPCTCPDIKLEIHNPHIGMYRYLDYVEMNDLWTNVGSFYGLVTNEDLDDVDEKNLANSIFLYNKNPFPVKVSYFICS